MPELTQEMLPFIVFSQTDLPTKINQLENYIKHLKTVTKENKNVAEFFLKIFKENQRLKNNPLLLWNLTPERLMHYRGNSFILIEETKINAMTQTKTYIYQIKSLLHYAKNQKNKDAEQFLKRLGAIEENSNPIAINNAIYNQLLKSRNKEETDKILMSIRYKL